MKKIILDEKLKQEILAVLDSNHIDSQAQASIALGKHRAWLCETLKKNRLKLTRRTAWRFEPLDN
jgi:hypothetical protein